MGRRDRLQLRLEVVELCEVLEARVRNMHTVLQASKNHSPRWEASVEEIWCVQKTAERSRSCWTSSIVEFWGNSRFSLSTWCQNMVPKPFTSDWDSNPCAGTRPQSKPCLGLEPTWLGLKPSQNPQYLVLGPNEAQVLDVSSQKEFSERQSER